MNQLLQRNVIKKIEFWKRVLNALDGIYNDRISLDESDSSSDDFWPKTRKNVNVDGTQCNIKYYGWGF